MLPNALFNPSHASSIPSRAHATLGNAEPVVSGATARGDNEWPGARMLGIESYTVSLCDEAADYAAVR